MSDRIWIDVGAFVGRETLPAAMDNPGLTVYAFEPNLDILCQVIRVAPNWIPIPMAVSDYDGFATMTITKKPWRSSILNLDKKGAREWRDGVEMVGAKLVPVIKLSTFMDHMGIGHVEFLKIDAQGADLYVVMGLEERLQDVDRIRLEVQLVRSPYYGAYTKEETVAYMKDHGFDLVKATKQSEDLEENLEFLRR